MTLLATSLLKVQIIREDRVHPRTWILPYRLFYPTDYLLCSYPACRSGRFWYSWTLDLLQGVPPLLFRWFQSNYLVLAVSPATVERPLALDSEDLDSSFGPDSNNMSKPLFLSRAQFSHLWDEVVGLNDVSDPSQLQVCSTFTLPGIWKTWTSGVMLYLFVFVLFFQLEMNLLCNLKG